MHSRGSFKKRGMRGTVGCYIFSMKIADFCFAYCGGSQVDLSRRGMRGTVRCYIFSMKQADRGFAKSRLCTDEDGTIVRI